MKALSLWQPYASAMQLSAKHNETRSWFTCYRGDLVICSSKHRPQDCSDGAARFLLAYNFRKPEDETTGDTLARLPYGFALCVVELYDCVPTQLFHGSTPLKTSQAEADLGDYSLGRFAWLTRRRRPLREPVSVCGHQGLFELTAEEESAVRRML